MTAPQILEPYVLGRTEEVVKTRPIFVGHRVTHAIRLSYPDPRSTDWVFGGTVLRARVRTHMGGDTTWKMLNTRRQWECMELGLCQVCGKPAIEDGTGRFPWVVASTGFWITGDGSTGVTAAPPTCWDHIMYSQQYCPKLREHNTVYTVASYKPIAVLCNTFVPRRDGKAKQTAQNIEIPLNDHIRLPYALATQLVVELHDVQLVHLT